MYEQFTDRARKVMQLANEEAQRFNHEFIGTEHILLGLVKEGSGVAANVLKNLDIDVHKIRLEVEKIVQSGPYKVTMGTPPQTPRAKKVIDYAKEEARNANHNYVGTEHLLLGLLREEEGVAAQVLMNLALKLDNVREEVLNLLGHNMDAGSETPKTPALNRLGRDLTETARKGTHYTVTGRSSELKSALLVLSCRDRNNLLLVGEPGTGKTHVLRYLAQLGAEEISPLRDRRFVALSVLGLAESAMSNFLAAIHEMRRSQNVVLVLDDLELFIDPHVGPAGQAMSGILRATLAWNLVQCAATTTPAYYQSSLANDAVFGRCFQPVFLTPLSPEETVTVLHAVADRYESHHRVQVQDEALETAVELSAHWPGQHFPGKAIQLLDQACALARSRAIGEAPDLKDLDAQLNQLNQEKEAAVAEQNFDRAAGLRDQCDRLKKQRESMVREWREGPSATVDRNTVVDAAAQFGPTAPA